MTYKQNTRTSPLIVSHLIKNLTNKLLKLTSYD